LPTIPALLIPPPADALTAADCKRVVPWAVAPDGFACAVAPEGLAAACVPADWDATGLAPAWVERRGRLEPTTVAFASEEELRHTVERILAPLGRRVDEAQPLVDARLPDRTVGTRQSSPKYSRGDPSRKIAPVAR